ncbi:hypothetical protein GCM10012286_20470 [Streptomyces lasiicapitis]|uniref:Lsr2 DNA-binding domain-containing protein n=1 Tax=Streptomyces lasiicapitis TaxID=1923961 RepID=A0ABQ2LP02_9ACTN|nr:hypothetical protein GCM10012286_20470 [Streptomyces lasiicapitis]
MAEDQDRQENQPGMRNAPTRGKEQESGSALRSWAKEQGYNLNDRGRVPADIKEAYERARDNG